MRKYTCAMCGSERYAGKNCWSCGSDELEIPMKDLESMLARRKETRIECAACRKDLYGEMVQAYPHDGGWMVGGAYHSLPRMRWWLSVKCECRYETSFDKFGIKR